MKKVIYSTIALLLLYSCGSDIQRGGCIDPIAENYDALADYDNGSCLYIIGCTDPEADNYDPEAGLEQVNECNYSAEMLWYLSESSYDYMFNNAITEFEIWESDINFFIDYQGSLYYAIGYFEDPPLSCLPQSGVVTRTITWSGNYDNNLSYFMWDIVEPLGPNTGFTHFTDDTYLSPNECVIIPVNGSVLKRGPEKQKKEEAVK